MFVLYKINVYIYIGMLSFAGVSMLRGGTWVCHVEQEIPLMIVGGVSRTGRRTGKGWPIARLGSGSMPWEAKMVESMLLPMPAMTTL